MKANHIILVLFTLLFASCAPEWLDEPEVPEVPESISISRHRVTMLVGDTLQLAAAFTPSDFAEQGVLWNTESDRIVSLRTDSIVAESTGRCYVFAYSVAGMKTDSCLVTVIEPWGKPANDRYDMVIRADVAFTSAKGQTALANGGSTLTVDDFEYAAFADGRLVARGEWREDHGVRYLQFRAWWKVMTEEDMPLDVTFQAHRRSPSVLIEAKETVPFDGETYGTLSDLLKLNF